MQLEIYSQKKAMVGGTDNFVSRLSETFQDVNTFSVYFQAYATRPLFLALARRNIALSLYATTIRLGMKKLQCKPKSKSYT